MPKLRQLERFIFIALVIGVLWGLPFPSFAAEWQEVTSPGGYYRVLMPGAPTFSHSSTESPVGRIPEELAEYKSDRVDFTAEVSLLPGIAVFFGGHSSIIDKASAAYLEHLKATQTSSQAVKSNGYTGKEIQYTATSQAGRPYRGTARFFLIQKRLYVLAGDTYLSNPDEVSVKKFLNSFQVKGHTKKKRRTLHPVPVH